MLAVDSSQQRLVPDWRPVPLQGPRWGLGPSQDPSGGGGSCLLPPSERAQREGAQVGAGGTTGGQVFKRVGWEWVAEEVRFVGATNLQATWMGLWHLFTKGTIGLSPRQTKKTMGVRSHRCSPFFDLKPWAS